MIMVFAAPLLLAARLACAQTRPRSDQTPAAKTNAAANTNEPTQKPTLGREEAGPDDVIRVKTTLVTSPVLVTGRDGKYVPSLRQEDFRVLEEGVEQKIAYFAAVDQPFTVALLIDTSLSLLFNLEEIQNAAASFVDKLRPKDQALIVSFDADKIKLLAGPGSDREALKRAIRSTRPGGNTPLYDAVDFANQQLGPLAGRKAIILFTDGVDNASQQASYESTLLSAANSEVLIYPVQFSTYAQMNGKNAPAQRAALEGSGFSPIDYMRADAYLHKLAKQSGTSLHPAADINELDQAVVSIVAELHNEYSLGYYPQTMGQPGQSRRIEVRVSQPQLIVRARTGYRIDLEGKPGPTLSKESTSGPLVRTEMGSRPMPRVSPNERLAPGSRWICKGPDAPGDLAVIEEGIDSKCRKSTRPNDETNAWLVARPAADETICKGFLMWNGQEIAGAPIPTGYAVVGEQVSQTCARSSDPKSPANAWNVRLPGPQETVCKGFVLPRGYVVIGEMRSLSCPTKSFWKNAWVIAQKSDTDQLLIEK
jgi:Ca-activated chloride channel homolog